MRKKDLEKNLRRSLHEPKAAINQEHLADTCLLAGEQASRRKRRVRISFLSFLTMQIRFIGWKIWLAQGVFLLLADGIFRWLFGTEYPENPLAAARALFCLSILVIMTALPFLYRSVRYRMQEVEAAARFSCARLLMAKLAIVGIGDLFILGGIFCIAMWRTSLTAGSTLLYLCFPYLFTASGCLFLLGHFAPTQFFAGSTGLCAFLILAAVILLRRDTAVFCRSFSGGWIAVCLILTGFCIWQFRHILYGSSYTELQLS